MPKILDEVEFNYLRQLQKYANNAVIAGGSVRDMLFGLPYNDVDIFYSSFSEPRRISYCQFVDEIIPKIFSLTSKDIFKNLSQEKIWDNPGSEVGRNINRVTQLTKEDGTKYQFISVDCSVEKHIKTFFDLDCVKVFHDGLKLHRTKEFEEFQKTKILELIGVNPGELSPITIARVRKFENRYGPLGFKLGENLLGLLKWHEEHPPLEEMKKKKNPVKVKSPYVTGTIIPTLNTDLINTYNAVYGHTTMSHAAFQQSLANDQGGAAQAQQGMHGTAIGGQGINIQADPLQATGWANAAPAWYNPVLDDFLNEPQVGGNEDNT